MPLGQMSAAFLGIQIPHTLFVFFTNFRCPHAARVFLECFQSVLNLFCEHVCEAFKFQNVREVSLAVLFQGDNVQSLTINYVVILPILCLAVVAIIVML
jgi:hypothetical protein